MDDAKLVARSKAAVLQAMQRYALEQSVEESVNVNPESESAGRQICAACGSANRNGNSFCANCGVPLSKTPEAAEANKRIPNPKLKRLATTTTIIIITTIISPTPVAWSRWQLLTRERLAAQQRRSRPCPSAGPAHWGVFEPSGDRPPQSDPGLGVGLQHQTTGRPGGALRS